MVSASPNLGVDDYTLPDASLFDALLKFAKSFGSHREAVSNKEQRVLAIFKWSGCGCQR